MNDFAVFYNKYINKIHNNGSFFYFILTNPLEKDTLALRSKELLFLCGKSPLLRTK